MDEKGFGGLLLDVWVCSILRDRWENVLMQDCAGRLLCRHVSSGAIPCALPFTALSVTNELLCFRVSGRITSTRWTAPRV